MAAVRRTSQDGGRNGTSPQATAIDSATVTVIYKGMQEAPCIRENMRKAMRDETRHEAKRETAGHGLSIEELAEAADVPVRTIRYYIGEGLLPGPGSRGKLASYGEEHLARLRLIRRLVERRAPLAELREWLAPLSLDEVRMLLREEDERAAELRRAELAPSPKAYVSGLLKQARAAREVSAAQASSAYPQPPGYSRPSAGANHGEDSGSELPSPRGLVASHMPAPHPAEAWQRWELVPGVELHVRMDAERRHRDLIRRLLADTRTYQEDR
jgi:DNA-binding transcriptional MerR regulator